MGGAQDDIHAVVAAKLHELAQVVLPCEIEHTLFRLVGIPEHIEAHRVHAQSLALLYALVPIWLGDTGVMQLGGFHHVGLAIEQESALSGFEAALRGF